MDRDIKFRVWHKGMNKMYSPEKIMLTFRDGVQIATTDKKNIEHHGYIERKSDVVELMQFTGLHDKNGKEIYEGDIVNGVEYNGSFRYGIVKYYKNYFASFPIGKFAEGMSEDFKNMEVIGNIYENKDLLDN